MKSLGRSEDRIYLLSNLRSGYMTGFYKADKATRIISIVSVVTPVSLPKFSRFNTNHHQTSHYHCQGCVGDSLSKIILILSLFLCLLVFSSLLLTHYSNSNATYPTSHWLPARETTGANIHPCSILRSHPLHNPDSIIHGPLLHPRGLSHKMVLREYLYRPQ